MPGSNLKDKSDEEIFYQDFKKFSVGKALIGVGQITSLNDIELDTLKAKMLGYMEKAKESNSLDMVFFMLTNILMESTNLICHGQGAVQLAAKAFHLDMEEATQQQEPRILNVKGYDGPLSIEWEDSGMDRIFGGTEACAFTKKINFSPSDIAFDDALKTK